MSMVEFIVWCLLGGLVGYLIGAALAHADEVLQAFTPRELWRGFTGIWWALRHLWRSLINLPGYVRRMN